MKFLKFNLQKLIIFFGLIGLILILIYIESCEPMTDCPRIRNYFSYYGLYALLPMYIPLDYLYNPLDWLVAFLWKMTGINIGDIENFFYTIFSVAFILLSVAYLYFLSCVLSNLVNFIKNSVLKIKKNKYK